MGLLIEYIYQKKFICQNRCSMIDSLVCTSSLPTSNLKGFPRREINMLFNSPFILRVYVCLYFVTNIHYCSGAFSDDENKQEWLFLVHHKFFLKTMKCCPMSHCFHHIRRNWFSIILKKHFYVLQKAYCCQCLFPEESVVELVSYTENEGH